jgi:hypothetical protein
MVEVPQPPCLLPGRTAVGWQELRAWVARRPVARLCRLRQPSGRFPAAGCAASRMRRYVLYETPAGHTCLNQEISFMRDYIELMHLCLSRRGPTNPLPR